MPSSGKYANGDRFVLSPCTLTATTPATVTEDAPDLEGGAQTNVVKHGAELNRGIAASTQSFTDRTMTGNVTIGYTASRNIGNQLPYVFASGEEGTITKSIFDETGDDAGRPLITRRYVVTVVAQEPPANAFRPGPAAPNKISKWTEDQMIDLSTLPSLAMPLNALNVRESIRWDQCVEEGDGSRFDKVNPDFNVPGRFGARGPGLNGAQAILALCSDITLAEKRYIAVAMCQMGIDLYERGKVINSLGHLDWGGENGQVGLGAIAQRGYKAPLIAAGILLNDNDMIAMGQSLMFAEDGSSFYVTQAMIDNGVTAPGNLSGGFEQYKQEDLGMPEWGQTNRLQSNSGNRKVGGSYRADNLARIIRHVNAIQLWPALYNAYPAATRNPLLDCADRYMERNFFKNPADPDNVFQYGRQEQSEVGKNTRASDITIWDSYRVSQGQTPIWDWPA